MPWTRNGALTYRQARRCCNCISASAATTCCSTSLRNSSKDTQSFIAASAALWAGNIHRLREQTEQARQALRHRRLAGVQGDLQLAAAIGGRFIGRLAAHRTLEGGVHPWRERFAGA